MSFIAVPAVRTQLVPTFFGKAIPSVQEDSPTTTASADQLLEFARLLLAKQPST